MAVSVRDGEPGEARAIAGLVCAAQATHRDWAGDVAVPSLETETALWRSTFARPGGVVRIADIDGQRAGVSAFAPARGRHGRDSGPVIPGLAHVSAVFVDPRRFRRGIGRLLLTDLDAQMRRAGFAQARLWTLQGSPAEAFYLASGWAATGATEPYPPMDLTTVEYRKRL